MRKIVDDIAMMPLTYEEWQKTARTMGLWAQPIPDTIKEYAKRKDTSRHWEVYKGRKVQEMLEAMRREYDLAMAVDMDGEKFYNDRVMRLNQILQGFKPAPNWYEDVSLDLEEIDISFRDTYPGVITSLWDHVYHEASMEEIRGLTESTMQNTYEVKYLAIAKSRKGGWSCAGILYPAKSKEDWRLIVPVGVLMDWFGAAMAKPLDGQTYYELLGIKDTDPTRGAIKKAYHRYAKQWHPDHCQEPNAVERFQRLAEAYGVLSDANKRKKYDAIRLWAAEHSDKNEKGVGHRLGSRGFEKHMGDKYSEAKMDGYQPPLRCGFLTMQAHMSGRWIICDRIMEWDDITNEHGDTLSTSWGRDGLVETWT